MKKFFATALALIAGLGMTACSVSPSGEGKATYVYSVETVNAQVITQAAIKVAFVGEISAIEGAETISLDTVELTGTYSVSDGQVLEACAAAEKTCKKFDYENNDSYKVKIQVTYENGRSRTLYSHRFKAL